MEKNNIEEMDYIEDINPDEIYKYVEKIKVGDIVDGKIIQITRDGVYVDIGSKTDGLIPIEEFNNYKDINKLFKPSEVIKVLVIKIDQNNVHIVSFRQAKQLELMKSFQEAFKNRTILEAKVLTLTDFGAIVDIGIDVGLSFREMTKDFKLKLKSEPNITVPVIIKEIKENFGRIDIIISQKDVVEIEQQQKKVKLFENIKEGNIVVGIVKSFTNFGAFIDIGGIDALLHISDIAWYRVDKPEDVLHVGDKIKVKILRIDYQNEKISVGLKQLFPHPWDNVENKYNKGKVVKCRIVNITNFGLFLELEPGIDGFVHISEVDWKNENENLIKKYKIGQIINAKILEVNKEDKKIALSIKKTLNNPWENIKLKYPSGTRIKAKVVKVVPFGIFANIEPGYDGLIHISNISWTREVRNIKEIAKVGDEIECIVLDVIPDEERAFLSIKHLIPNPYEKFKEGTIVRCKVKKLLKNLMVVELEENLEGIIRARDAFVDEKDSGKNVNQLYKVGQELDAVVIISDEKVRRIELSIKSLEKETRKQLIKKYSNIKLPSLKDILEEN